MAKDGKISLPSVDGVKALDPPAITEETKQMAKKVGEAIAAEIMGYVPRNVDVRMSRSQAEKFKAIQRELEDAGATLKDGSPVNNRRRAVLWMIENYVSM
jgi:hypothetical protein